MDHFLENKMTKIKIFLFLMRPTSKIDEVIVCDDVFKCICSNLTNLEQILELQLLDKHHQSLFRKHDFVNTEVNIVFPDELGYIIKHFNFVNYIIYDKTNILKFKNKKSESKIRTLKLSLMRITDISILSTFTNLYHLTLNCLEIKDI